MGACLVRVRDAAATTALEVAAGGKLNQVHYFCTLTMRSHGVSDLVCSHSRLLLAKLHSALNQAWACERHS